MIKAFFATVLLQLAPAVAVWIKDRFLTVKNKMRGKK